MLSGLIDTSVKGLIPGRAYRLTCSRKRSYTTTTTKLMLVSKKYFMIDLFMMKYRNSLIFLFNDILQIISSGLIDISVKGLITGWAFRQTCIRNVNISTNSGPTVKGKLWVFWVCLGWNPIADLWESLQLIRLGDKLSINFEELLDQQLNYQT